MKTRTLGKLLAACLAAWIVLKLCGCTVCTTRMDEGLVVACADGDMEYSVRFGCFGLASD